MIQGNGIDCYFAEPNRNDASAANPSDSFSGIMYIDCRRFSDMTGYDYKIMQHTIERKRGAVSDNFELRKNYALQATLMLSARNYANIRATGNYGSARNCAGHIDQMDNNTTLIRQVSLTLSHCHRSRRGARVPRVTWHTSCRHSFKLCRKKTRANVNVWSICYYIYLYALNADREYPIRVPTRPGPGPHVMPCRKAFSLSLCKGSVATIHIKCIVL